MKRKVRVVVADDSKTVRDALKAALGRDPRLEVVGEAADGAEAIERARALRPDVMTMDILMPAVSGLEAISAIMATAPLPIVVVASVDRGLDVDLSFRAMAAGALEVLAKPSPGSGEELHGFGRRVADALVLMAEVPVVTRRRAPAAPRGAAAVGGRVDAIGLVASTGGPPALAAVLAALPRALPVPVLIAQHIAAGFVSGLVRWFAEACVLPVEAGRAGATALPGRVYVAPDACHLELGSDGRLEVTPDASANAPSGNRLLASLARAYGDRACGVVLTGMGEDGARGLLAIRDAGGVTLAQDAASAVVYGMPQAAVRLGAAGLQLPVESIGATLAHLCGVPPREPTR